MDEKLLCDEDIEEYYDVYYADNAVNHKQLGNIQNNADPIPHNPLVVLIKLDYICEEDIKDDLIQYYENNIKPNKITTL